MNVDAWLPVGFPLPDGSIVRRALYGGTSWQIAETAVSGRVLLVAEELMSVWISSGLVQNNVFETTVFGSMKIYSLCSTANHILSPVYTGRSPRNFNEALAFAHALVATRAIDAVSPLQDGLYVERLSRILPTLDISPRMTDDFVLGSWLTGGARISTKSSRRIQQMLSWLPELQLQEVLHVAGLGDSTRQVIPRKEQKQEAATPGERKPPKEAANTSFRLFGRPELELFFNEHVVDIVQHPERYRALGVGFPAAIALHGPPGTGKTFAVEALVAYLGWPSYQIDAASVASPYIHDTSKKIAEVFDKAMENSPSVLVIDEMEAFLADREPGQGHHRLEEVAEFLRRIPEATSRNVLIIGMTNRIELVDSAILRRGRFDHIIEVGFASKEEIAALLRKLLETLPVESDVDVESLASKLAGRPLSDVTFVIREAARLAGRARVSAINQLLLLAALHSSPSRETQSEEQRRIGFM